VTIKCYDKPNRTKPRYFSGKDVGRCALYSKKDGADEIEILTRVWIGLGMGWMLPITYDILVNLKTIIEALLAILSLLSTGRFLSWLMRSNFLKLILYGSKVNKIFALIAVIIAFLKGLEHFTSDLEILLKKILVVIDTFGLLSDRYKLIVPPTSEQAALEANKGLAESAGVLREIQDILMR
jgi:hypothetical protein